MKPLKASDLYRKLKAIEERVRRNENPDGSCNFEIEKVYIFLESALSQIPEAPSQSKPT